MNLENMTWFLATAFFGITPGLWMNLQLDYEFTRPDREKVDTIPKEGQPCAA